MRASPSGFDRLLARLDPDPARAGREFERLRRTLVKFFDWRGALAPEDAADETLERLAGKLEQEVTVLDVPAFAHGIARLVLHEVQRDTARHASLEGIELAAAEPKDGREAEDALRHLRLCLDTLPREGKSLLLAYYAVGDGAGKVEGRQRLARKGRLSPNALRSRVQRLRDRVEDCVRRRCQVGASRDDSGRDTFSPGSSPRGEGRSAMPEDAVIRKYLLGDTTEDEAASLEREYFATEQALDEVGAAEWDLIEDYLGGRLTGESRARFEGHYLGTPAHRSRLAMARALQAQAAAPQQTHKVLYFFPLAAAAILMLAVLAVVWGLRLPGGARLPEASVLTVELPLVAVRGEGEPPTARLREGVGAIDLRLERGEAAPPYEILVRTVEGSEVWHGRSEGEQPAVRIPATSLSPGDYVVVLRSGSGGVGPQQYYLRVLGP